MPRCPRGSAVRAITGTARRPCLFRRCCGLGVGQAAVRTLLSSAVSVALSADSFGLLRSDMRCHVRVIDVGAARLIMRDDVSVITQPLSRFTPTGVEFEGGRKEDYDAVVFATGFQMASGHYDWLDRELSDMIGRGKTALEAGLQVRPPALTLLDPEPENEP